MVCPKTLFLGCESRAIVSSDIPSETKWFYPLNVQSYTVRTSGKVNVSSGRPMDRRQPDVSASANAGCRFRRPPAVTSACGHSTPTCANTADCSCRFLAEQWSAASHTVAVSMYLQVTSTTSCQNRPDRQWYCMCSYVHH